MTESDCFAISMCPLPWHTYEDPSPWLHETLSPAPKKELLWGQQPRAHLSPPPQPWTKSAASLSTLGLLLCKANNEGWFSALSNFSSTNKIFFEWKKENIFKRNLPVRIRRNRREILCFLREALPKASLHKHTDNQTSLMQGQSGHTNLLPVIFIHNPTVEMTR